MPKHTTRSGPSLHATPRPGQAYEQLVPLPPRSSLPCRQGCTTSFPAPIDAVESTPGQVVEAARSVEPGNSPSRQDLVSRDRIGTGPHRSLSVPGIRGGLLDEPEQLGDFDRRGQSHSMLIGTRLRVPRSTSARYVRWMPARSANSSRIRPNSSRRTNSRTHCCRPV